jgi:DNA-binding CsgD family transcriptional regulator
MLMTSRTDTIERWFDALNAHDVDALVDVAHPGIEIVPLPGAVATLPGTTYHGHPGVRSLLVPGFERWPRLQITPGIMDSSGDLVIVPVTFTLDDSVSPPEARRASCVFWLAGDRVRRVRSFESGVEARRYLDATGARLLTAREREIITLLAEGLTADEVAASLVISPFTVRTHIRNAKDKLGARTTGHAIAKALRGPSA